MNESFLETSEMNSEHNTEQDPKIVSLVKAKIEALRPQLLDLTRRNPLINTRFSARSTSYVRVVHELPDVLLNKLSGNTKMTFMPLPPLDSDPKDEQASEFQLAFKRALVADVDYQNAADEIDPDSEDALKQRMDIERDLKDRVREDLGMPERQDISAPSLAEHAKLQGFYPSYELPNPEERNEDDRFTDNDINTLLLSDGLDRCMTGLTTKCRTWEQETGINVLHGAFGFLEWGTGDKLSISPIILLPVMIKRTPTNEGPSYDVTGNGSVPELNNVLLEILEKEYRTVLPDYNGGSVESYLQEIVDLKPRGLTWRVRRFVAFGVFPAARMAMYHDLATEDLEPNQLIHDLLGGTAEGSSASPYEEEYDLDDPQVAHKVPMLVMDADSSQMSVLVDVADGRNIAIEGPPGTGKSQTIVNMIANALGDGKKVLFVAEKMAALEVVRNRLNNLGMREFILPLQAHRATKTEVVQALRERVKMPKPRSPADLEKTQSQLRITSTELKRYIDCLAEPVLETGYTVHDILGATARTSDVIKGVSQALSDHKVRNVGSFSHQKISVVLEVCEEISGRWEAVRVSGKSWRGLTHGAMDRFTKEQMIEQIKNVSKQYEELDQTWAMLSDSGFVDNLTENDLTKMLKVLRSLADLGDTIDIPLLCRIIDHRATDDLEKYYNICLELRELRDVLSATFVPDLTSDLVRKAFDAREVMRRHSIDTLNPRVFDNCINYLQTRLNTEISYIEPINAFLKVAPELGSIKISDVSLARDLVSAVPTSVLILRTPNTINPAAAPIICKAVNDVKTLLDEKSELETKLDVDALPSSSDLRTAAQIIQSANIFSIFSGEYRAAKKLFLSLSRSGVFQKAIAGSELRQASDWKARDESLNSNTQIKDVFGINFRGRNTDFSPFQQLLIFLENVDETLGGPSLRELRLFLKSSDLDSLSSMPIFKGEDYEITLDNLNADIEKLDQDISLQRKALEEIRPFTGIFKQTDSSLEFVDKKAQALDDYLTAEREIKAAEMPVKVLMERANGIDSTRQDIEFELRAAAFVIALPKTIQENVKSIIKARKVGEISYSLAHLMKHEKDTLIEINEIKSSTGIDFLARGSRDYQGTSMNLKNAYLDIDGLLTNASFFDASEELDRFDLKWVLFELLKNDDLVHRLAPIMEAIIYRALSISVYQEKGKILNRYTGKRIENLRRRFKDADIDLLRLNQKVLRAKVHALANPPSGNQRGPKKTWTDMALIENEINKKRYIPVRELTRRATRALTELKPCWMVSPLALANYLPKGLVEFDLCIIDEASQMPPENALGALLRSKQVIVVGDTNQLPPSTFFKKILDENNDDDIDEEDRILEPSILQIANQVFRPQRRLRWHYRSRHSDLIKFSNRMMYDDDLIVFPNAFEQAKNTGVSLINVDGLYRKGVNIKEAEAVVQAAVRFTHESPDRSLGIVTLNQKQRDIVIQAIDQAFDNDTQASKYREFWAQKNDGLEALFVKNLENVQGDERDAIFISTVHGPEQPGAVVMNRFVTITGVAGQRRLNVLFSRAKHQVVTFSSMKPTDIRADEDGNPGSYMLKRWLEFSATKQLEAGENTQREPDSDFEIFVMDQLRGLGCDVTPQVGAAGYFIDIGVKHPSWPYGYILGVECDGASYHSSKSARDRDRLRQQVLEGLGWHFHRIWSTDWFNDSGQEVKKLAERIRRRLDELESIKPSIISPEPIHITAPEEDSIPLSDIDEIEHLDVGIDIGDTVDVRYLDDSQNSIQIVISDKKHDPDNGIVHVTKPLANSLLGYEEGNEIEILIDNHLRRAIVEKVKKNNGLQV